MAESDNSSNTPYGSPDFKQNDLVRDYLTKLAQFISGQPVAAGAATPAINLSGASGESKQQSSSLTSDSSLLGGVLSQELASAIRELATALRAFQSPAGQSRDGQEFLASQVSVNTQQGFFQDDSFRMPERSDSVPSVVSAAEIEPIPLAPPPSGVQMEPMPLAPLEPGTVQAEPIPLAPLPPSSGITSFMPLDSGQTSPEKDVSSAVDEFKRFLFDRDSAGAVRQPSTATFDEMPGVMSHLINGTDHMQDLQSAANMYRDAMAMFNRRVVNILEGITNDLRGDNSRLAEIERHFFQARTSL